MRRRLSGLCALQLSGQSGQASVRAEQQGPPRNRTALQHRPSANWRLETTTDLATELFLSLQSSLVMSENPTIKPP